MQNRRNHDPSWIALNHRLDEQFQSLETIVTTKLNITNEYMAISYRNIQQHPTVFHYQRSYTLWLDVARWLRTVEIDLNNVKIYYRNHSVIDLKELQAKSEHLTMAIREYNIADHKYREMIEYEQSMQEAARNVIQLD